MAWLTQLMRARRRGAHVCCCVGAIGDGFPWDDPMEPVDALLPWEVAVGRTILREDGYRDALAWTFDAVRGFLFLTPKGEERFRALLGSDAPPPVDAIGVAQQRIVDRSLPREPDRALRAMARVFQRAAEAEEASERVRCIAILPDVDAIAGRSPVNGGANPAALAILQIAASDAVRRAGHWCAMSAPSLSTLDERFARPDAPIAVVEVRRPDAMAREAYLATACADPTGLADERTALEERQRVVAERTRIAAQERLDQLRDRLVLHERAKASRVADDADAQRCRERLAACERERAAAARPVDAERREFELALAEMDAELRTQPEHRLVMSADDWASLAVGDRLLFTGDDRLKWEKTVLAVPNAGKVHLSMSSASSRDPIRGHDEQPTRFVWANGKVWGVSGDGREREPFMRGKVSEIRRIPRRVIELRSRRLEIEVGMDPQRAETPAQRTLAAAEHAVREASEAVSSAERACLEAWNRTRMDLEREIAVCRAQVDQPTGGALDAIAARLASIDAALAAENPRARFPTPAVDLPTLARITAGFSHRDLVGILRTARADGAPLTEEGVCARRIEILERSYGERMRIVAPAYGFEGIAGLDAVKQLFVDVREAIRHGDLRSVPMGCMLMGPPGVGKSAIAQAFARECGFLFVELLNQREMFVGRSEANVEQTIAALRALAPIVVFRDEIDEEDSGRDSYQGDSGVSSRIRKAWMEFLADPTIRGRVFVVSATNRPDRMDAALKRAGRTDERIMVPMPDLATREALFRLMVHRYAFPSAVTDYRPFAEQTGPSAQYPFGYSGGDIEVIVRRAHGFAHGDAITPEALRAAVEDSIPSTDHAQVARMVLASFAGVSSHRYRPKDADALIARAREVLGAAADVPTGVVYHVPVLPGAGPADPEAQA